MPADVNDIELRYAKLKTQYENGDLNYETYIRAVDALRMRDKNGIYWQIRANDGKWVRWDGSTWVPGNGRVPCHRRITKIKCREEPPFKDQELQDLALVSSIS